MNVTEIMDGLPLPAIFLAWAALILLSMDSGFRIGRRQRSKDVGEKKIYAGPVVAASLGLLAFILAFAFSAVTNRLDDRKKLVLQEANAIGTTFLRADVLPAEEGTRLKQLLYDYATLRIEAAQSYETRFMEQSIERSEKMQGEMWAIAIAAANKDPTPVKALLVQTLNDLIDLHTIRVTVAKHRRMPIISWFAIAGLAMLAMLAGGYEAGLSGGRRSATTILVTTAAFSLVLLLIVVIERPVQELTAVSQGALIDVQQSIRESLPSQQ